MVAYIDIIRCESQFHGMNQPIKTIQVKMKGFFE